MSLNTWLVKNLQYVLSNFELSLILLSFSWLLWWGDLFASLRVTSWAAFSTCLCMHFAPQIHTLWRATALSSSSSVTKKHSVWLNIVVYAGIQYPAHEFECKLTFRAWPQIDIPNQYRKLTFLIVTDTYVHMYTCMHIHCENRSLIQSLTLVRSAIMQPLWLATTQP